MMAVYDLEEQEQIDEIKAWWKQYGNALLLLVVVAALTVAAVLGWRAYNDRQGLEAGELYVQLQAAVSSSENKKVQDIGATMIERYPRSGYAQFAALAVGRAAFETGSLAEARTSLKWVVEHAKDDGTRDLARLRLATVALDEKKYDEALATLQAAPVEAMAALFADLKGDILAVQEKTAEARSAYQLALDKTEAKSGYRNVIQGKLDSLGTAK